MNLLYVSSNPKPKDEAVTLQMGEKFIEGFLETHPETNIEKVDLYDHAPPYYDYPTFRYHWFPLFIEYTPTKEEELAAQYAKEQIDLFHNADILVISCPMWNFSMPAILKAWFDQIIIPEKVFFWNDRGELIIKHKIKTAVLLCSSGGEFFNNAPNEHLVSLLKNILNFIKIEDIKTIFADRQNPLLFLEQENVKERSIEESYQLGKTLL